MPPTKPPMKRRKVPGPLPPTPPTVSPPEDPVPVLKISGTKADPNAVDEGRKPWMFNGNTPAAQTPEANAKRKQSLQVSHALKRMLSMTPQQFEEVCAAPGTVADQIATQLLHAARGGVMDAIKTVYDRTEGRVPQSLDVNTTAHKDVHERVSEIARDRANSAAIAATRGLPEGEEVLDVSEDGADRPEGDDSEPGVAGEAAG